MPLIWKDGRKVEGTTEQYVQQLRGVAERMRARFGIYSDERGLISDFIWCAADEIERLAKAKPIIRSGETIQVLIGNEGREKCSSKQ